MKFWSLFIVFSLGCSHAPKEHSVAADPIRYQEVVSRLSDFLDQGFIVSRKGNDNHGDSLIFTGLGLYGSPCLDSNAELMAQALESMLKAKTYYRFPGDPDSVTMDQYLGLYRGIASRIERCGEKERWKEALSQAASASLPAGFDYVRRFLMSKVDLESEPPVSLRAEMEGSATLWSGGVIKDHAACYRVHLSLIALQTVEELGGSLSTQGKAAFCSVSRGTKIATLEHFCGRSDLGDFLTNFTYDVWQYKHQRCPDWESPDGNGEEQPAIDYLVAYRDNAS